MRRLACISLPDFPLQLLLERHPEWRGYPAAVLAEDRAQGSLCWINELARDAGIRVGHTHAQALALSSTLRAGMVAEEEQSRVMARVVRLLGDFSPEVECSATEPGVFWCNASGVGRLFKNISSWAKGVRTALRAMGLQSSVVVGFRRFGCYALARTQMSGLRITKSIEEEERATKAIAIEHLDFSPRLRSRLQILGIVTLGEFGALSAEALGTRFGVEAHALHGLATGTSWDPLRPETLRPSATACIDFDCPVTDSTRLMFAVKRPLDLLLDNLATEHRAVKALFVEFKFDHSEIRKLEVIRPAEATLNSRVLLSLLQMRLESNPPRIAVVEIHLRVHDVLATRAQLSLFSEAPRRELHAANEALARVRAELGNDAIVCAVLRDGHLPEARFFWQEIDELSTPVPCSDGVKRLSRRIFTSVRILSATRHYDPYHFVVTDLESSCGRIKGSVGPYSITGGWWNLRIHRDYYYLESRLGDLLWVYRDRVRNRWILQGRVE